MKKIEEVWRKRNDAFDAYMKSVDELHRNPQDPSLWTKVQECLNCFTEIDKEFEQFLK